MSNPASVEVEVELCCVDNGVVTMVFVGFKFILDPGFFLSKNDYEINQFFELTYLGHNFSPGVLLP